jgi:hypothetical protein
LRRFRGAPRSGRGFVRCLPWGLQADKRPQSPNLSPPERRHGDSGPPRDPNPPTCPRLSGAIGIYGPPRDLNPSTRLRLSGAMGITGRHSTSIPQLAPARLADEELNVAVEAPDLIQRRSALRQSYSRNAAVYRADIRFSAVHAVRALPWMDEAFRSRIETAARSYATRLDQVAGANPFDVPITTGGCGGSDAVAGFAKVGTTYFTRRSRRTSAANTHCGASSTCSVRIRRRAFHSSRVSVPTARRTHLTG